MYNIHCILIITRNLSKLTGKYIDQCQQNISQSPQLSGTTWLHHIYVCH